VVERLGVVEAWVGLCKMRETERGKMNFKRAIDYSHFPVREKHTDADGKQYQSRGDDYIHQGRLVTASAFSFFSLLR
jgi:hypothetical protein